MLKRVAIIVSAFVAATLVAVLCGIVPVPIGDAVILAPPKRPKLEAFAQYGNASFTVRAADGTVLRGHIVHGTSVGKWILMNDGNGSDVRGMDAIAKWFARATGASVALWDYRGYGFSGGKKSIAATRRDALDVYDALRAREGTEPIVYGLSFGTTIAVAIAGARPVRGLILHAPPSSAASLLPTVRDRWFPWFLRRVRPRPSASLRIDFDIAHEVARLPTPLLVLHGESDQLIPISEGRAVYEASTAHDKRFVPIPHADHRDVDYDGTAAGAAVTAFIARH